MNAGNPESANAAPTPPHITPFEFGPARTIGYLVSDPGTNDAVIIDTPPGCRNWIRTACAENRCRIAAVVLTHGHWDHVGDAALVADDAAAPLAYHPGDEGMILAPGTLGMRPPVQIFGRTADRFLSLEDRVVFGQRAFRVLHVPGHTPGHIALFDEHAGVLFCGDVLFRGSVGRTDLPGASWDLLMHSITTTLFALPDDTVVYPGHGPATTIGLERRSNPFVLEYLDHLDD